VDALDAVPGALSVDRFGGQDLAVVGFESRHLRYPERAHTDTHRAHTKRLPAVLRGYARCRPILQIISLYQHLMLNMAAHAETPKNPSGPNRTAEVRGSIPLGSTNFVCAQPPRQPCARWFRFEDPPLTSAKFICAQVPTPAPRRAGSSASAPIPQNYP